MLARASARKRENEMSAVESSPFVRLTSAANNNVETQSAILEAVPGDVFFFSVPAFLRQSVSHNR